MERLLDLLTPTILIIILVIFLTKFQKYGFAAFIVKHDTKLNISGSLTPGLIKED